MSGKRAKFEKPLKIGFFSYQLKKDFCQKQSSVTFFILDLGKVTSAFQDNQRYIDGQTDQ